MEKLVCFFIFSPCFSALLNVQQRVMACKHSARRLKEWYVVFFSYKLFRKDLRFFLVRGSSTAGGRTVIHYKNDTIDWL